MASESGEPDIGHLMRTLASGVVEITLGDGWADWGRLAECVGAGRIAYLLANFRRANRPPPDGLPPDADCFLRSPPEIRDTDSLHVFTLDCTKPKPSILDALAAADAGMVIFSDRDGERLMAGQQILWAWFSRPSLLVNQLTNGSADLAMRLLELPQIVLIESPSGSLSLFTHATLGPDLVRRLSEGRSLVAGEERGSPS